MQVPTEKQCPYDPVPVLGAVSMHHCPICGEMVIAGVPHPDYSQEDDPAFWQGVAPPDCPEEAF